MDAAFFEDAPFLLRDAMVVPSSAERVWAELTADDPLSWCRILQRVTWTSPRPFGVGTTREVRALWGLNVFHERYFRWEEGRRHSFYVERASGPLFRRFAEDYLVEPLTDDTCRFTWTIAAQPRGIARFADRLNSMMLKTLFIDTRRHFRAEDHR